MSRASAQTSLIGLLAPNAPSAYPRPEIEIGSKNVVAAEVARAACQIVALSEIACRSELYDLIRAVLLMSFCLVAQTKLFVR